MESRRTIVKPAVGKSQFFLSSSVIPPSNSIFFFINFNLDYTHQLQLLAMLELEEWSTPFLKIF